MYLERDPDLQQEQYSEELNGITHDDNNWYLSQAMRLWRIPVALDLGNSAQMQCNNAYGVACRDISSDFPAYSYNHIGDISYFHYVGDSKTGDFLFVPLEKHVQSGSYCDLVPESCVPLAPAIAVYDPDTLKLVAYAEVPLFPDTSNAPWVAVDPGGNLYIIGQHSKGALYVYAVDYGKLFPEDELYWPILALTFIEFGVLLDESGNVLPIDGQGGVITDSGGLLYLVSGGSADYHALTDGINVFDISFLASFGEARRIRQSSRTGNDVFHFNYEPGDVDSAEEPEGVTIWDLEGTISPHTGRLHVAVNDNDWPDSDDTIIHHFTNRIYVDSAYEGFDQTGHPDTPSKTVESAAFISWDGAVVTIKGGSYPENITLDTNGRVLFDAQDGYAIIGN